MEALQVAEKGTEGLVWQFKDKKGNVRSVGRFKGEALSLQMLAVQYNFHGLTEIKIGSKWYGIKHILKCKQIPMPTW